MEDISDRRAMEESLRQAQKMEAVGQLTGGIAHDFNNLLTIVNCAATTLQEIVSPQRQDVHIEIDEILGAARRGADVVRKLLAFARRTDLNVRPVDLAATVRDTVQMLLRFLPASVSVQSTLDAALPAVMADAGALEHVILNLAKNAADAMPDGGHLVLRTRRVNNDESVFAPSLPLPLTDYVVLEVEDTGTGMSAEVKRRLFEPFYTTKAPGLGSGLGLAMVYGIMRQHQGVVAVESQAGSGTTVRLFLPVSSVPGPHSRVSRMVTPDDVRGGSESILLVDDDTAVRDTAQRVLESKGYLVVTASDGIEALQRLDEHAGRVDLVISDLVMPQMGGVKLARRVAERGDRVRVLLTSGHMDESNPEWAELQSLPLEVLRKPWGNAEFLTRIRTELDLLERDRRDA